MNNKKKNSFDNGKYKKDLDKEFDLYKNEVYKDGKRVENKDGNRDKEKEDDILSFLSIEEVDNQEETVSADGNLLKKIKERSNEKDMKMDNDLSFMIYSEDITEEDLLVMDIFDVNKPIDEIEFNPVSYDLDTVNLEIVNKLAALFFDKQAQMRSKSDALYVKNKIDYLVNIMLRNKNNETDYLLSCLNSNMIIDLESDKSLSEWIYIIDVLKRLKQIYKNHLSILTNEANKRSYSVIELIDDRLITKDDLRKLFGGNLDIDINLNSRCVDLDILEFSVLEEIKNIEKYNKIKLSEIEKDISNINKDIERFSEGIRIDFIIIFNDGIKGKRVRYSKEIANDKLSKYIVYYSLVERIGDNDYVRYSRSIGDYNDYLEFKKEVRSLKRGVLNE